MQLITGNKRSAKRRRIERGAVATIVAVMLAGGVLLGMAALAVDVGALMFERRQLQNGADAAAMKLAGVCARDVNDCDPAARSAELSDIASQNASDNLAQLDTRVYANGQCGRVAGVDVGILPACVNTGDIANLRECTPLPAWVQGDAGIPYVQTYTLTDAGSGASRLLPFFGGGPGTEVSACARAVWGSPGNTGITFPLAIRACDWEIATANGADLAPSPPYAPAGTPSNNPATDVPDALLPHVTHVIAHATGNAEADCDTGLGASQYAPGGFGWLNDPDDNCSAAYNASGVVTGDPGASPSGSCKDLMQNWLGMEVLVPVFTSVAGTGSNTQYTLTGVSAFYFAGWQDLPSAKPNKTFGVYRLPAYLGGTSNPVCEVPDDKGKFKSASCIWGWFTGPVVPVGTVGGSVPSRGPEVVQMIG